MAVKIGRRVFISKAQALEYFSRKLRAMKNRGMFWDDELYELFKHHPRFAEKTQNLEVKGFVVKDNPLRRSSFTVYAVLEDGSVVDFSYRKCIENAFNPAARLRIHRLNVIQAFRRAVEDQIIEFKESRRFDRYVILDNGVLARDDEVHVHHEPQFEDLLEEFLRTKRLTLESNTDKRSRRWDKL
ncbi:hypothetical protein Igag_1974 [Ignisphaera aggregans DSM 17230]|uniref:DUF3223 domain-containing protein n=1 Tax=Ignisphaera aggregans (strain DSM 17230 / JCM 13409 / AQ1.S1) TaxID=583356 RepID=E0STI0_IGNAA|nr:hypothetical protein Igag_1974 [Ignisphaera aggregans DSM 17230]